MASRSPAALAAQCQRRGLPRGRAPRGDPARRWNPEIGAFSASYGDPDVDAGILQIAFTGMLPPDDPKVVATVLRVERILREGEVVYRYRHDDGLSGGEGGFLLCAAWLIEAFVAIGRVEDARELFDRYVDLAGPTGLLSEEYDPLRETALGNFPQAYSHAGLINAGSGVGPVSDRGGVASLLWKRRRTAGCGRYVLRLRRSSRRSASAL